MNTRRRLTADFKAKLPLEVLREQLVHRTPLAEAEVQVHTFPDGRGGAHW